MAALTAILVTSVFLGPGSTQTAMASTQIDINGPAGSDAFGSVTVLSNGNIVIVDQGYNAGAVAKVGAVYLYNGATGALISTLTGSTAGDQVGSNGVTVLSNGNFVVRSAFWNNGGAANAGAATWGNGMAGVSGEISAANSLIGSTASDGVGDSVIALSNGNYVVLSYAWDANTGAATWGDGKTGVTGPVSAVNSLVGAGTGAKVGWKGIALKNGDYVTSTPYVANGSGAVSLGRGHGGTVGPILSTNSVLGMVPGGGSQLVFGYDDARDTLVVGQPAANKISLFKADLLFTFGFE